VGRSAGFFCNIAAISEVVELVKFEGGGLYFPAIIFCAS